jgi:ABC-type phosphate/phosphonate transport system substrate-binding protein
MIKAFELLKMPFKKNLPIWLPVICCLTLEIMVLGAHAASGTRRDDYPKLFRYGVLNLLAGVNQNDAHVAIEMHFVMRNQNEFPGSKAKLEILPDVDAAARMFRQKRLHGISLTGIDYLALREQVSIDPIFISSRSNKPLEAYVLLASKDLQHFSDVARLSQRRLVLENLGERNVGQIWLDNVLWEHGHKESKIFFSTIQKADKPSRMVLPVFFGQAEVCLVPESAYHAMVELNPQIGTQLKILMRSPEFVRSIHCTYPSLNSRLVDAIKRNAIGMEHSVDGQQLMLIFQFKRHFLFDPDYIKGTERIYRKYKERMASH